MRRRNTDLKAFLTKLGIIGLVYAGFVTYQTINSPDPMETRRSQEQEARTAFVMGGYTAVGNGGALANVSGQASPERMEMNERVQERKKSLDRLYNMPGMREAGADWLRTYLEANNPSEARRIYGEK